MHRNPNEPPPLPPKASAPRSLMQRLQSGPPALGAWTRRLWKVCVIWVVGSLALAAAPAVVGFVFSTEYTAEAELVMQIGRFDRASRRDADPTDLDALLDREIGRLIAPTGSEGVTVESEIDGVGRATITLRSVAGGEGQALRAIESCLRDYGHTFGGPEAREEQIARVEQLREGYPAVVRQRDDARPIVARGELAEQWRRDNSPTFVSYRANRDEFNRVYRKLTFEQQRGFSDRYERENGKETFAPERWPQTVDELRKEGEERRRQIKAETEITFEQYARLRSANDNPPGPDGIAKDALESSHARRAKQDLESAEKWLADYETNLREQQEQLLAPPYQVTAAPRLIGAHGDTAGRFFGGVSNLGAILFGLATIPCLIASICTLIYTLIALCDL